MSSNRAFNSHKGTGNKTLLADKGWNLLAEDVGLPAAVLSESALEQNAQWMQRFSQQAGVKLAPHGKTTMAPSLFKQQLDTGAWAISLATIPQVISAYQHDVRRVIMANQLVGKYHCEQLVELLRDPSFEFYCFVDSVDNLRWLGEFFQQHQVTINVLLEIGVPGGRCGWRDLKDVSAIVDVITKYSSISLAGLSFYEGVIHGDNAEQKIVEFISEIKQLCQGLVSQKAFDAEQVLITGAGSAWYDVVAKELTTDTSIDFVPVIRPGCYLIHDTGIYQDAQQSVMSRSQLACDIGGDLVSSLTIWAYVHSVPEPGLMIIGFGKRDAAFDAGLPTPELHFRPGDSAPKTVPSHWQSVKIMDQHLMVKTHADDDVKVGDIIVFSTSHPCLTMDKWRFINIADENYVIHQQIETFF